MKAVIRTQDAEAEPAEAGGEVRAGRGRADAAPRLLVRLVAHHALQPVAQRLCARATEAAYRPMVRSGMRESAHVIPNSHRPIDLSSNSTIGRLLDKYLWSGSYVRTHPIGG